MKKSNILFFTHGYVLVEQGHWSGMTWYVDPLERDHVTTSDSTFHSPRSKWLVVYAMLFDLNFLCLCETANPRKNANIRRCQM